MYSAHPLFQGPSEATSIWRYLDFVKYVSLLKTRSLYFARPGQLGDRFEGSLTAGNQASIEKTLSSVPPEDRQAVRARIAENTQEGLRGLAVNCWYMGEQESAAMWRLYVKGNQGIAIQSSLAGLKGCVTQTPLEVYIGQVKYIDYDKETFPEDNMFWQFLHKRRSFEYERELRAVIWEPRWGKWLGGELEGETGIDVGVNLETLVENAYVSPTAPKWFRDLVRSISSEYGIQREPLRSNLDRDPLF